MKFIKIKDLRINVNNIIKYYQEECNGEKYVVICYTQGKFDTLSITIEELDKLINPPTTPRPRGLI